jgi:outer membrane PBP1 activator LpoA protein
MIFISVTPAQGRQIKPTLVFQYANKIPVYATSSIYSGDVDAVNNEDLNGVLFNTLPWVFDNNNPEKQAIAQNTKSAAVYGRLHALGADAFHLYSRLSQLKRAPDMRIYGATGSLQLLPDGRTEREQMWARFNEGLAEPLTTVVDKNSPATIE